MDAGGTLDNIVTASSNEAPDATDDLSIPISQTASITVEKSSATTSLSAPGTVTYDYLVTNTGNVTITGLSLSDNNDNDDMVCAATTIAVGGSTTCTATHTFTQAELDAGGTLDNIVTASSNEAPDATDDLSIPISQTASITVEKSSATTSLSAPGTVTYDYLVTNTGNVTITGLSLSDNNDNDDMVCAATTIAVGGSTTCTATHTFTQAELDAGGTLDNIVTASSNEAPDATDDLSIPITQSATLSLDKSGTFDAGADGFADVGELITYTFVVTNTGNVTLNNVTVTDPLPGLSAITFDGGDTDGDGELDVDEIWTYSATYAVTQADIDAGNVVNTATADSDESDPATDDNDEPLPQNPVIDIVKDGTFDAGADGFADPGELISYSFTVTNEGNVSLTNVSVTDPLPGLSAITFDGGDTDGDGELDVDEIWTYSATYAVTQADIDAGNVVNTATADSDESDPATDDNDEPLPQNPVIDIVKDGTFDAGADGFADPGELISYSFTVTNDGQRVVDECDR